MKPIATNLFHMTAVQAEVVLICDGRHVRHELEARCVEGAAAGTLADNHVAAAVAHCTKDFVLQRA